MTTTPAPTMQAVALLERAIDYTRIALSGVRADLLDGPTPCEDWDLRTLLSHMDDGLAAFTEAGDLGTVDLRPLAREPEAHRLVESLRLRACSALGAWSTQHGDEPVAVGGVLLDAGVLAGAGALEITVHGWDVARACGLDHPIPASLADALLDIAVDLVGDADRGARFGPAHMSVSAEPGRGPARLRRTLRFGTPHWPTTRRLGQTDRRGHDADDRPAGRATARDAGGLDQSRCRRRRLHGDPAAPLRRADRGGQDPTAPADRVLRERGRGADLAGRVGHRLAARGARRTTPSA